MKWTKFIDELADVMAILGFVCILAVFLISGMVGQPGPGRAQVLRGLSAWAALTGIVNTIRAILRGRSDWFAQLRAIIWFVSAGLTYLSI